MSIMYAVLLALVTGMHAATWGAFKDSPFEGFKAASFVRTIVLAMVAAAMLATATDLETTMAPILLVGVLYAIERLATELWKSFVREDDQDAYAIPMRIAVLGRPIDGRFPRYLTGFVVLVGVVVMGCTAAALQPADGGPLWMLVLVGGIGGWLTAVGGAWKDAPVEGFSGWKFLRSPVVATAWTMMVLPFTHHWVTLTVAAAGLSVLSIETYKTFFTGGRPPGKFDGKPVRPELGVQRDRCRLLHSGVYVGLACVTGMAALSDAVDRLSPSVISLVVLTVVGVTMSILVALSPSATEPVVRRRVVTDAVPS
jgi:hypothetical protein